VCTTLLMLIAAVGLAACVTTGPPATPATVTFADPPVAAAQIGAEDLQALETFYESAFGLKEVGSIPGAVMLNFGETVHAARSNPSPQIAIMGDARYAHDPVAHLVFAVADMQATVSAIEAAGGRIGSIRRSGKNGPIIRVSATDPTGNALELVPTPATKLATPPSLAMPATVAFARVSLHAIQLGAWNVALAEKFYQSAFGLKEVDRVPWGVMLNSGETVQAAKSNPGPQIVLMRPNYRAVGVIPHLILAVTDMQAAAAVIQTAGGCITSMARFGQNGLIIGVALDPAGNRLELVQPPAR
jgi:predicted enzyme related to lactoylglutathione lyase